MELSTLRDHGIKWKKFFGFLPFILLIDAIILLKAPLSHSYPMGYAGLFSLMFENLRENHFVLPMTLPYYNAAGIPFAYPPSAFYFAAIVTKITHLDTFHYLRYITPVFGILCTTAFYILAQILFKENKKSSAAALLFISTTTIYEKSFTAAGMVRGFALFWCLITLIFTYLSLNQETHERKWALLAMVGFALTVTSHLSYAVFFIMSSIVLFFFSAKLLKKKIQLMAIIYGGAFILSSPWWVTVILRYGFSELLVPLNSHNTLIRSHDLMTYWSLFMICASPLIAYSILFGIFQSILKKNWFLPVWFCVTFFLISEGERYWMMIGCLLIANMIIDWSKAILGTFDTLKFYRIIETLFILTILILFVKDKLDVIYNFEYDLDAKLVDVAHRVEEETTSADTYLFITTNHNKAEWFPYLSKRVPVVGHWGTEWLGTYNYELEKRSKFTVCVYDNSFNCIESVLEDYQLTPSVLVLEKEESSLIHQAQEEGWLITYENSLYTILAQ